MCVRKREKSRDNGRVKRAGTLQSTNLQSLKFHKFCLTFAGGHSLAGKFSLASDSGPWWMQSNLNSTRLYYAIEGKLFRGGSRENRHSCRATSRTSITDRELSKSAVEPYQVSRKLTENVLHNLSCSIWMACQHTWTFRAGHNWAVLVGTQIDNFRWEISLEQMHKQKLVEAGTREDEIRPALSVCRSRVSWIIQFWALAIVLGNWNLLTIA